MDRRFTLMLTLAMAGLGCGTSRVCAPGATQACVCASTARGAQSCAADGTRWEPCVCGDSQAATGGAALPPATGPEAPTGTAQPAPATRAAATAAAPACPAIRDIDWKNRSYSVLDLPGENGEPDEEFRLRDGRFEIQPNDGAPFGIEYSVGEPAYGDVTGDGHDEAVVDLWFTDGGTHPFSSVRVFSVRDCRVVLLDIVPNEHDGLDTARNPRIESGRVVVQRYDMAGLDHGSPRSVRTEYWQLAGDHMLEDVRARTLRRWSREDDL